MSYPFDHEQEPRPESSDATPAKHMDHAATAINLYSILGLTNEDSVKFVAELLRPPHSLEKPADLVYPGVKDYYTRFKKLSEAAHPGARPFEAAKYIHSINMPISQVLDEMLEGIPADQLNSEYVEFSSTVLPEYAEHIRTGRIAL